MSQPAKTPDFHQFHMIVINTSAGKDSQAMMHHVVQEADKQNYPRDQMIAIHADLGRIEWDGTKELAQQQAEHYDLRFLVEKRPQGDLLQHFRARWEDLKAQAAAIEAALAHEYSNADWKDIWSATINRIRDQNPKAADRVLKKQKAKMKETAKQRGLEEWPKDEAPIELSDKEIGEIAVQLRGTPPWSSPTNRFCTSDHKRGQISRSYTALTNELRERFDIEGRVRFINCMGFRAQESPARAARKPWSVNKTLTTKGETRIAYDWLPIHEWDEDEVWLTIDESGAPHHWAYDRGMGRLSCRFCIFAPKNQLMIAAVQPENWDLFCEYVKFEEECGFTFTQAISLKEIKNDIEAGKEPDYGDNLDWNM